MDASAISYDHGRGSVVLRGIAQDVDVARQQTCEGDAVAIGWLVNARMRKLRKLCAAQIPG